MNTLLIRVISAIVAIVGVASLYFFLDVLGLKILIFICIILAAFELGRILFSQNDLARFKNVFTFFLILLFSLICSKPGFETILFSIVSSTFIFYVLISYKKSTNLNEALEIISRAVLGFMYLGILPTFAFKLLMLPGGSSFFLILLSVVFAGDIGAYFVGSKFGKTKLMPAISPKKSLEGAIAGLLMSFVVGYLLIQYSAASKYLHLWQTDKVSLFMVLIVVASIFAQVGDFFESLIKRIADIKDSGTIMPGHGGILDRIDGVLFAAPILYYAFIMFLK